MLLTRPQNYWGAWCTSNSGHLIRLTEVLVVKDWVGGGAGGGGGGGGGGVDAGGVDVLVPLVLLLQHSHDLVHRIFVPMLPVTFKGTAGARTMISESSLARSL